MKTVHVKAGELPWGEAEQFPGWSWKSLREDPDGVSVSLWRLAPGGSDELHAHADAEEHLYVLRGEFECGGVTYKAGDYLFSPGRRAASDLEPHRGGDPPRLREAQGRDLRPSDALEVWHLTARSS